MATDFYDYANLRLLIPQPAAIPGNLSQPLRSPP